MQREQDLTELDQDCPNAVREKSFTCEECGKTFQKPIYATILTGGQTQSYYACPRCMTKVTDSASASKENEEESSDAANEPNRLKIQPDAATKCPHFFGYLKKRDASTPFPDECLTCSKTVECMTQ